MRTNYITPRVEAIPVNGSTRLSSASLKSNMQIRDYRQVTFTVSGEEVLDFDAKPTGSVWDSFDE